MKSLAEQILDKHCKNKKGHWIGLTKENVLIAMEEYASDHTEKYKELCVTINDYATFLGKQLDVNATFLWIHGVSATKEDIQKGAELRDKIEQLKKELP